MPVSSRMSSAVARLASWEDSAAPEARVEDSPSPKVKFNGELNGYHFPYFSEHFICREELPRGSETFQQVLDEITREVSDINVSDQPQRLPVSSRRKSVATMTRPSTTCLKDQSDTNSYVKSERKRKISWGKPVYFCSETSVTSYSRPRVCSDGAVIRRKSVQARRRWYVHCFV